MARRGVAHVRDKPVGLQKDVDRVFPDRSPARFLSGARYRENMTQQALADKTGIPRRHISEMENKKRPIGKKNAQKLAKALNVNYQRLL